MLLGRFGKCFGILLGWFESVWEWFGHLSSSPVFLCLRNHCSNSFAERLKELEGAWYPRTWVLVHPGIQIPRHPGYLGIQVPGSRCQDPGIQVITQVSRLSRYPGAWIQVSKHPGNYPGIQGIQVSRYLGNYPGIQSSRRLGIGHYPGTWIPG